MQNSEQRRVAKNLISERLGAQLMEEFRIGSRDYFGGRGSLLSRPKRKNLLAHDCEKSDSGRTLTQNLVRLLFMERCPRFCTRLLPVDTGYKQGYYVCSRTMDLIFF